MKISAFPIYRFFRNGLPAMTKAGVACAALFGVLAFVIFSPGFSFRMPDEKKLAPPASVNFSDAGAEAVFFRDSEPLFLPTARNFGARISPEALHLREPSFLPFGEVLLSGREEASAPIPLEHEQIPPRAENALGADAWGLARGFAAGPSPLVPADVADAAVAVPAGTRAGETLPPRTPARVRIVALADGSTLFAGTLDLAVPADSQTLLNPAEYFCGIAFEAGAPRVQTVRSCGNADVDAELADAVAGLLKSLAARRGAFRISATFP